MVEDDSKCYGDTINLVDSIFWKEAINKRESLMTNRIWILVNLPQGCKPMGYKMDL